MAKKKKQQQHSTAAQQLPSNWTSPQTKRHLAASKNFLHAVNPAKWFVAKH